MAIIRTIKMLFVLAGVLGGANLTQAQETQKIKIGLASASLPASAVRFVKELGLFEKHGIDASVVPMDNASVATSALISGSVDFTVSASNELVFAKARGLNVVAVENLYQNFSGVLVLSKYVADKLNVAPDAPVGERLKALDGLVIATPDAKSSFTFVLRPAAQHFGANVRFTYIAQTAMTAALESGAIQGFVASSPAWGNSVLSGKGVEWINGPKGQFPKEFLPGNTSTLNAMLAYAKQHPDLLKRVHSALEEFKQAVKERPSEVKAAIKKVFPNLDAATLDVIFDAESEGFQTTPITRESMVREMAFVKLNGVDLPNLDQIQPESLIYP
jgi:ABC-type nitrate/sulfonate/bicarbonate transport system substrate-binding protein